jgi:hypothetical protein
LFGVFFVGLGLVFLLQPEMFASMPQGYRELVATGEDEATFGWAFGAIGASMLVLGSKDARWYRVRMLAGTLGATALFGLSASFKLGPVVTTGTYTYGVLMLALSVLVVRLSLMEAARLKGRRIGVSLHVAVEAYSPRPFPLTSRLHRFRPTGRFRPRRPENERAPEVQDP